MMKRILPALVAAAALTSAAFVYAESPTTAPAAKPYPLKTCLISKEELGGDMGQPVTTVYKGQEMKFCCADCKKAFDKDPAAGLKKYQAAVVQSKSSGGKSTNP